MDVDVAVVGRGIAGTVVAARLARAGYDVVLVGPDGHADHGEVIPAQALRMLGAIEGLHGLSDELDGPRVPIESSWGGTQLDRGEPLLAPLGPPLRLEPTRLAHAVERRAVAAGARCVRADLRELHEVVGGWELRTTEWWGTTRFVVDASGRARIVARACGEPVDTECEQWAHVATYRASSLSSLLVEATPTGWWYASPLADDLVLGVHVADVATLDLDAALAETVHVGRRLRSRCSAVRTVRASVERLPVPCGRRWAAAGSAALALDPLAGAGTSAAIGQGSRLAEAVAASLHGRPELLGRYASMLDARWADHLVERTRVYATERRWASRRFWRRRTDAHGDLRADRGPR